MDADYCDLVDVAHAGDDDDVDNAADCDYVVGVDGNDDFDYDHDVGIDVANCADREHNVILVVSRRYSHEMVVSHNWFSEANRMFWTHR